MLSRCLAVSLLSVSCSETGEVDRFVTSFEGSIDRSARRVEDIAATDGATVRNLGAQVDGSGTFSFGRMAVSKPGSRTLHLALFPDGEVAPLRQAERRLLADQREHFGALTLESSRRLVQRKPVDRAVFWYDATMWSHDALRKAAAEMSGGEALEKVQMPILELVGWDSDEGLVELAKFEGIHRVDLLQDVPTRARGVDSNWQIPNQALTTNVHQIFNANGFDGLGQTIGIFDDTQKGCRIWDEHEAFANVDGGGVFHTELTSLSCTTDSDCRGCSTAANPGHCVGPYNGSPRSATNQGFCVSEHATYVASRASAYQNCQGRALPPGGTECELNGAATAGEPFLDVGSSDYMASRSRFVFRNDTTPSSATAFAQAYDTFLQDGASLVVETFGKQSGGYSEQDLVGDWYARHRGLM